MLSSRQRVRADDKNGNGAAERRMPITLELVAAAISIIMAGGGLAYTAGVLSQKVEAQEQGLAALREWIKGHEQRDEQFRSDITQRLQRIEEQNALLVCEVKSLRGKKDSCL
jgi:hypothetical protein